MRDRAKAAEYDRKWRAAHREEHAAYNRRWREAHREESRRMTRLASVKYRARAKQEVRFEPGHTCNRCDTPLTEENWTRSHWYTRQYICRACRQARDAPSRRLAKQRYKLRVLSHYGGTPPVCADPYHIHEKPFGLVDALSIDHVEGGGAAHRRSLGKGKEGSQFYTWLVAQGFPAGFQVLCMNCQWLKKSRNLEGKPRKYA